MEKVAEKTGAPRGAPGGLSVFPRIVDRLNNALEIQQTPDRDFPAAGATTFPSTFNASSNTLFLIFLFITSMRFKTINPADPQRPTGLITHSGRLLQPAITMVIYR